MSVDATKDTFQAHPVEEVERALDLEAADREDLPSLVNETVDQLEDWGLDGRRGGTSESAGHTTFGAR